MAALRQILFNTTSILVPHSTIGLARFSTRATPYSEKVGIPEFLNGIGKGVEAHVAKIETEIGDIEKLLVTRTLRLKKLGIPVKQFLPYFYVVFLTILLLDRAKRDDDRCRSKYRKYWKSYCQKVPFRVIPGIY